MGFVERFGAQQPQVLLACLRDSVMHPTANGGLLDAAQARDCGRAAQVLNHSDGQRVEGLLLSHGPNYRGSDSHVNR